MKKLKKIPILRTEDEVDKFWSTHDSTEYIDWTKARQAVFPNLKMSTRPITMRITRSLYQNLKQLANKKDIHYQSLIKVYLEDKVAEELGLGKYSRIPA
jgi:predicted DNA binding CopG/RHH family protein